MKFFSALILVVSIALTSAGMTDEEMEMMMKMSDSCIEQTGVPKEIVMKVKDGVFESDPKLSEYLFCMFKTSGFMSDAGEYQIDAMKTMIGKKYGDDAASEAVDECTVFQGEKLEKALKLAKCLCDKKSQ